MTETTGTASVDYLVEGMTCGHCVASVREEVGELAGVTGIDVALVAGGRSRVSVAGEASEADVKSAVETAGYTFAGRA